MKLEALSLTSSQLWLQPWTERAMRLFDASRQLSRFQIERDHRRMGWFGLMLAAAGVLSLAVAALVFDF